MLFNKYKYALSVEASDEIAIMLDDIRGLSNEYSQEVRIPTPDLSLPSTHIQALDDLLKVFSERFADNGTAYKVIVNGSIIYMTENVIDRSALETMIGDHLQNALIAVNSSDRPTRSVMVVMGEAGDYYTFSVHDSGIPFEVDTLTRLGMERVTTHADAGGYGIGFMKPFETMLDCGASLLIRENEPVGTFTKSITIRFDGKNNCTIETYRSVRFPPNGRYPVIDH